MPPYMSLLVLVLVTTVVSPVRALDPDPLGIKSTSHSERSERPRFKITPGKALAVVGTLLFAGIMIGNSFGGPDFNYNNPTNTTQPTQPPTPPPTSPPQPANPPRAFAGRILDRRGLSVDTSKARSISDNDNQKIHKLSPDLLNRDHLGEALELFSRIADELD